ncbi:MAG: CvpA family protein [Acutalibacteraceae bacterium]
MSIILDLIVLAIIVLTVILSAKRGFVRTVIELVGFVAAVIISFTISTPLAGATYDKIIEPSIVSSVTSSVDSVTADTASKAADEVWEKTPGWIKNSAERLGVSKESIDKSIVGNIGNSLEDSVTAVSQDVIKPVVTQTLSLIFEVLVLVILLLLVKPLAKLINKLFSFSIIGKANRVLGGIVGIPKGIIIAMAFCLVIILITSFTSDGFLIFTDEAMEKSWFFSHIAAMKLI